MKSAVLTLVAVLSLSGAYFVASGALDGDKADPGIDPVTTASTSSSWSRPVKLDQPKTELAQAQTPALQPQVTTDTATQTAADKPVVDESALRYFARKGDKARLDAEIARLRALYPDWTPPADPLAAPEVVDRKLDAMWKLYSEAKYDEVRKAIAERQTAEPGWKAPADLLDRLAVADKRQTLITASTAKRYDQVVDLASATPNLLTCSDLDVLWRVADAFGNTARLPRALDAYNYILDNCTKEPERLATMMKASALLDYGQMQTLIGKERKLPNGTGEFEPVRDDLSRRFVGEGGTNAKLEVAPVYIDRVKALVEKGDKASDALLLGWYYVKRNRMTEAGPFFRKAHDTEDTASASQGLALTLIAAKNPKEAEDVMYKWRGTSNDGWATYFAATANLLAIQPPPVIAPEVLSRMAEAVTIKREIKTAENFGWYALAYQQPRTAAQWFRTTLIWKPDYEPAAYGLTVARLRLKDTAGVKQMQRLWGKRSERIARITDLRRKPETLRDDVPSPDSVTSIDPIIDSSETQSIDDGSGVDRTITTRSIRKAVDSQPVVRQVVERRPVEAALQLAQASMKGCNSSIDPSTLSPNAALTRGWCLMELNRPIEAAAAFGVALRSPSAKLREDAAYGQSLAYLRAGLVDEAAVAATKARQGVKRAVELQTAILADRATNAFDAGRFRETITYLDQLSQLQTERTDLMVLRAYAYRQLGRRTEAASIFEALAASGNRDAIKALGDMKAEDTTR